MRSCPSCGASAPPDAGWCGQCYARIEAVTRPERPLAMAAATAPAAPTVDRFGLSMPSALPGQPPPPARAGADIAAAAPDGRMVTGRAWALVATAIGIGIVGAVVSTVLGSNDRLEPAAYLRYAIVITLGVYAAVGVLIVTRLVPGVSLRWHRGRPATSILVGAGIGAVLGFGMLGIGSAAAGHLSSDARIVLLMSEGDLPHIVISFGIACICAPLVEETLFRGVLLESLRARRVVNATGTALVASGVAFAVWHLMPNLIALGYYTLMGMTLGGIYLKRGLVGSMAAHLAFNGVLTVAALAIVLAPTTSMAFGNVTLSVPGGWSRSTSVSGLNALEGPSGSALLVSERPSVVSPSVDDIASRIREGLLGAVVPGIVVDTSGVRQVQLNAGVAVEVDLTAQGHRGTLVFLPRPSETIELVFLGGGSAKATADFTRMLDSLQVG